MAGVRRASPGKGHQGQGAAFALVVGAEQNEHIFRGDDEDEGPQDERQHAEHRSARQIALVAAGSLERDAEGIEWARADVAIDDTHAAERERPEGSPSCLALSTVYSRDFGGPRHSTWNWEMLRRLRANAEQADAIHCAEAHRGNNPECPGGHGKLRGAPRETKESSSGNNITR